MLCMQYILILKKPATITYLIIYSGPWILRPSILAEKNSLKLKVILTEKDIYIPNVRVVPLVVDPKFLNGGNCKREGS